MKRQESRESNPSSSAAAVPDSPLPRVEVHSPEGEEEKPMFDEEATMTPPPMQQQQQQQQQRSHPQLFQQQSSVSHAGSVDGGGGGGGGAASDVVMPLVELPPPPDGGWGWVVCFASFMCNLILDGIAYTFGVLLEPLVESFDSDRSIIRFAQKVIFVAGADNDFFIRV